MSTLSDRLRDATRDIVTGERLLPGLFGHSPIEDLEAAADELDRLTEEAADRYKSWCEMHSSFERGRDEIERLTARVAELEQVVARCSRVMRGEGVSDQGEAWDLTLRTLDAALESKHE